MDDELRTALANFNQRLEALEQSQKAQKEAAEATLAVYESVQGLLSILKVLERGSVWLAKMATASAIIWWIFRESVRTAGRS